MLGPSMVNLWSSVFYSVPAVTAATLRSYSFDTQLYITESPDDTGPVDALFNEFSYEVMDGRECPTAQPGLN